MSAKPNAQQLAHALKLRKRNPVRGTIPSAFSEHRRVNVDDVFNSAGKIGKDGMWKEAPVSVIGSGLGHRIYPGVKKMPDLMRTIHYKEYLWCDTFINGAFKSELVVVRNRINPKNLKEGSIAFRTGKCEHEFVRLVTTKEGLTFWVYRI